MATTSHRALAALALAFAPALLFTLIAGRLSTGTMCGAASGRVTSAESPHDSAPPPSGATRRNFTSELFVISLDPGRVEEFRRSNHGAADPSGVASAAWFPATDGLHQGTLNLWRNFTGRHFDASDYERGDEKDPEKDRGPHEAGCYLSHWHLLRLLARRPQRLRPDAYFIFEDDAVCVPRLKERAEEVMRHLPEEWDMLFVGGKPFSYFNEARALEGSDKDSFRRDICRGAFGMGEGPLAPDGSRKISAHQPYWQTKYTTNTEAYVVNPQRMDTILKILDPSKGHYAIDLRMGDAMKSNDLRVFMPSETYCQQKDDTAGHSLQQPMPWEGYFSIRVNESKPFYDPYWKVHPALADINTGQPYLWGEMIIDDNKCSF